MENPDAEVEETKYCKNCKRDIGARNFVMHEMHCSRHLQLCPKCDEPIPKDQKAKHDEEYHALVKCKDCQQEFETQYLEEHTNENCPKRLKQCVYCDLQLPMDDLQAHIDYCGSRTENCTKCSRIVLIKDLLRHEESGCAYPKPISPPPQPAQDEFEESDVVVDSRFSDRSDNFFLNEIGRMHRGGGFEGFLSNAVPPRARRQLPRDPSPEDEFTPGESMLPCEYCGEPFNIGRLARHQERCSWRPDEVEEIQGDDMNETLLPCEFCKKLLSPSKLNFHQPNCIGNSQSTFIGGILQSFININSREISSPQNPVMFPETEGEESLIPCEFCSDMIPMDQFQDHMRLACRGSEADLPEFPVHVATTIRRIEDRLPGELPSRDVLPEDAAASESDDLIPCEFCGEIFPVDQYSQHSVACESANNEVYETPSPPRSRIAPNTSTSQRTYGTTRTADRIRTKNSTAVDTKIACHKCNKKMSNKDYTTHSISCTANRVNSGESRASSSTHQDLDVISTSSRRRSGDKDRFRERSSDLVRRDDVMELQGGASEKPSSESDDLIPCEFCGEIFPVDQYSQHSVACESANNEVYETPSPPRPRIAPNTSTSQRTYGTTRTADRIWTKNRTAVDEKITCPKCNRKMSFEDYTTHSISCTVNRVNSGESRSSSSTHQDLDVNSTSRRRSGDKDRFREGSSDLVRRDDVMELQGGASEKPSRGTGRTNSTTYTKYTVNSGPPSVTRASSYGSSRGSSRLPSQEPSQPTYPSASRRSTGGKMWPNSGQRGTSQSNNRQLRGSERESEERRIRNDTGLSGIQGYGLENSPSSNGRSRGPRSYATPGRLTEQTSTGQSRGSPNSRRSRRPSTNSRNPRQY